MNKSSIDLVEQMQEEHNLISVWALFPAIPQLLTTNPELINDPDFKQVLFYKTVDVLIWYNKEEFSLQLTNPTVLMLWQSIEQHCMKNNKPIFIVDVLVNDDKLIFKVMD